jgi:hypothetical protein
MKIIVFMIGVCLTISQLQARNKDVFLYWNVVRSSSLEIHGTTNVNDFQCASGYFNGNDQLIQRWNTEMGERAISGDLFLEVNDFDCKNRVMNRDFQHTLKSEQYPVIKVRFLELKEANRHGQSGKASGWVEISMAGKKKKYPILCDLIMLDDYYNLLKGSQVVRFSDFDLEPPQKGLGLVRVNDKLTVTFDLMLEKKIL